MVLLKGGDGGEVWMDVTNEDSMVPVFGEKIIAKVAALVCLDCPTVGGFDQGRQMGGV